METKIENPAEERTGETANRRDGEPASGRTGETASGQDGEDVASNVSTEEPDHVIARSEAT